MACDQFDKAQARGFHLYDHNARCIEVHRWSNNRSLVLEYFHVKALVSKAASQKRSERPHAKEADVPQAFVDFDSVHWDFVDTAADLNKTVVLIDESDLRCPFSIQALVW